MQPEALKKYRWILRIALALPLCILRTFDLTGQQYTISQSGTYSIEIDNPTFITVDQDNATEIPIGFAFDFFGNTYTDCWVGGDGFIAFGDYPDPTCCGEFIPDNNTPNNLIAVAWMNVDWISAHYEVYGSQPNRRLVITFDLLNPCDSSYYGQVKLFEGSNKIEIHTQQWYGGECQGWSVTQGIENEDGSVAYPVPDRNNNDTWQVLPGDDDFVSFTPSSGGATYIVEEAHEDFNLEFGLPYDITIEEDGYAEVFLDFPFEFFGIEYNSVFIGFNGFIAFEEPFGGGCCEGQNLPDPNYPNNLIAAAWTNVYPGYNSGNYYYYGTVGDYPNRRFVVEYYFDDDCYNAYYYGQIHLLEEDFSIEIHTDSWAYNAPCYNTTQGIEGPGGAEAYFLPERNANTSWNVPCCGDMVRFIPTSSLPQADAGVSHIFNDPYCEGSNMMSLLIRNYGGMVIDSVEIHWSWDGVLQDPVSYFGTMPVGDFHFYIPLDTQDIVFGQSYELKAWTSMPNGVPDDNQANDTLTTSISAGLHGTFTIGGTSPDFHTIQEAIDSLQSIGVCDTVTMLIRPGTYNEQVIIPYIPGVFSSQVIFTAENGDSSSVIVEYEALNYDSNYVVMFTNAYNITWEKMTINAINDFEAVVIELRDHSSQNTIQHCEINGKETTSTSYAYACIFSRAQNHDNAILNNTTNNGSYGYYHEIVPPGIIIGLQEDDHASRGSGSGNPEDYAERTKLIGNQFLNFGRSAIRTSLTKGLQVHHNHMQSTKSNVWALQIYEDLDTLSISNNTIYAPNGLYGLHLSDVDPVNNRATVFNNMINVPGSNTSTIGARINNCNGLDFFHNTVRIHNTSITAYPFYLTGGEIDSVYNNIFANTNGGPAIFTTSSFLHHFDYNNYYTSGSILGRYGSSGNNAPDITAWQNFTGFDDHSIAYDPLFDSDTDLHASASLINGKGSGIHSVTIDIDAEIRDPNTPDPGADEFTPEAEDAGITGILSPLAVCEPEQDITLVLTNLGTNTLSNVTIEWSVNGVLQAPVNFSPDLGPEGDTSHVVLTSYIFTNQPDTFRFWTSLPNGLSDEQPENDTLSLIYRLPLQGEYTIGGTSPDFLSFNAAALAMKQFTICGPVTFKVRDGIYTEQVFIDSISGSSPVNTITFESESLDSTAVTLQFSSNSTTSNYVMLLNGTDYITFRHLSFVALNTFYADIIDARNGVKHLTLTNNYFDGTHLTGSSGISIKSFAFGVNEYFTIRNNYFKDGHYAVYFINPGSSLTTWSHDIIIENNLMQNQRYYGLHLSGIQGLWIRDNVINTNSTNAYIGININNAYMTTEISGNTVQYLNAGSAMFLNSLNFQNNSGIARVFNNMTKSASSGEGIRVWNSRRTFVQYNTSYAAGSGNAFELVGGDSCVIQNNIFVSNTGRTINSGFSTPPTATFDYNNLYSIAGNIGYWNNTNYATLPDWQAGTSFDIHSMSVDPEFVSSTDLHILADTLDGAGTPIAGITEDIDKNPRNGSTPDIGADEIGANDDDAGILVLIPEMPFARGTQDVKAIIRNFGGNTITSVDIHWELNDVSQPVINYSGSLPSLQQDTVVIGFVDFALSTPYVLKSWTSNPNGQTDYYNSNDTLLTGNLYAAVSDTVTIGGTMPDVATITDAVTALSFGGVLDSVHFQIRNGTYHTVLSLPQTIGMDCNTPIIFESESGNPADVIWDNLSLNNHTILLDGADGVTFKNLTIRTLDQAYHAVEFKNGANCNTLEGCMIEGVNTTSTGIAQATVYAYSGINQTNTIKGNTIKNGSYGIYWHGNYTTTGLLIDNNEMENAYYAGITISGNIAPQINRNIITSSSAYSYIYGIQLTSCTQQSTLNANQILLPGKRGAGILLSFSSGTSTQPSLVTNNYINIGQSTSSYGIQHYYSSWSRIYNNTVRITGGNSTGVAYYRSNGANLDIINNLFDNRATGPAMHFDGNEGPLMINYNDLYHTGSTLVHYAGSNYADLEAWQVTDFDTNSISVDPMFVNEEGYAITSAALNAAGTPLDDVMTDIEGELRDMLTPDMGCDEFSLLNDDVGILAINFPTQPFPSGENTVFIKFINNGQDTLVSMQVDWEVDSIPQPTYYWTGLLPSAGTYDSLDIGVFDFAPYQSHTIKAWVSLPNGVMDQLSSNDTLVAGDLFPALLGAYTIGGTNPDFDSIGIAVDILNQGGAVGPVTFNIRTGTYLETINLVQYSGSDCNTPVVFQSESGDSTDVIIKNLGIDDNIITLDGTDGVTFQNLTLESVNPSFRNVIAYSNGAHCNQFLNNRIIGFSGTSFNLNDAVILSSTSLDTANVFSHNHISNGSYGFYLIGNGTYANTVIENNIFSNNYYMGIYAASEGRISVLNNLFYGGNNSSYHGVYLLQCHGANRVEGNNIQAPAAPYILRLETCHAVGGERGRVMNNFLSSTGAPGNHALRINNSKRYDVYHNNIYLNTNAASTAGYFNADSSLHLVNNIWVNEGAGSIIFVDNQTSFYSDYNNYFGSASFGTWNNGSVADLEAWQTASTQDTHSLDVNPLYMSSTDLHVGNILLNGSGLPLAGVLTDIDGDPRGATPDIGADEFDPSIANDAGVFMYLGPNAPFTHGNQPVTIALKNFGYESLTSVDIRWTVNGIEQTPYAWTGSLPSVQCDTVVIGNFSFAEHSGHDLIFWTEFPNGEQDSLQINDTLAIDDVYPALLGTYTVGGVLPDFNIFAQMEAALNNGGILGDVFFNVRNGTYSTQLEIDNFPRVNYGHTVTFQSESGDSSQVNITKNFYKLSSNYTVRLNDAHNIHFKHLTLGSTQGRILDIANGSSNILVENCKLKGVDITYGSYSHQLIYSNTTTEDTLIIVGNHFENGDQGIHLTASGGAPEKGVEIENNYFYNIGFRAIHTQHHDGLQIKNNRFFNDKNQQQGIVINNVINLKEVSGNDIRMTAGGLYGIYLQSVSGTSGIPGQIYNNYILIKNHPYNTYGIYHATGNDNDFNYNTIRLENSGSGSVAFYDYYSAHNINLRNCILANYTGGLTIQNQWYTGSHSNTMDHCDLYTTGTILAQYYFPYNNLEDLQAATNQNLNSISAEPLFNTDGPYIFQAACDGAGDPVASITTDLDGEERNATNPDIGCDEFTLPAHDVGAKLLVDPETYCGLSNAEDVTIRIQNYGSSAETGFDVAYSVNGSAWMVENIGGLSILPGSTLDYTFSVPEDLSQIGLYTFAARTALLADLNLSNDTIWEIEVEHIPALTQPVSNMIPTDGQGDLETTVSLSWAPAPNATRYDLYLWEDGTAEPGTPQVANLVQINTLYYNLTYGKTYNWRVVAKNICNQMVPGPVQQFSIRELPNLQVDTVIAPATAFSGQTIEVEWQVYNAGPGSTQSTLWADAVYLSSDATLNTSFDIYLGPVQNLTALDSGVAYTQTGTFIVPQGLSGNYYVFVFADRWNSIQETSNADNWERTPTQMMVSLTPAPDLIVTSVTTPTTVFSGEPMTVSYTVENNGLGAVPPSSTWLDRILIGLDPNNAIGTPLQYLSQSFELLPDSSYMVTQQVAIPEEIAGTHYMHVTTDYQNTVFEFSAENNNTGSSQPINVILAPPADLVAIEISFPDTVSNNEIIPLGWEIENQGAGPAEEPYWVDQAFLSLSPIYNPNFLILVGAGYQAGPLDPFTTYSFNGSALIPLNLSGHYYVYLKTDSSNEVFEHTNENNNILKSPTQIFIANADLVGIEHEAPDTAIFGSTIPMSWKTINSGLGKVINRVCTFKVYLSDEPGLTSSSVLLYTRPPLVLNMDPDDTLSHAAMISLPPGFIGHHYLVFQEDATNVVFEGAMENNNLSSRPIFLEPGPTPDIYSTGITIPDTITAGMISEIQYDYINQGNAVVHQNWMDKVYISFDSVWNPAHVTELITVTQVAGLQPGVSRTSTLPVIIPTSTPENVYYFYVVNDQPGAIYEGPSGESNNIRRSEAVYVQEAPPVDLTLDTLLSIVDDTLYSGIAYPFSWITKNIGTSTPLLNTWSDKFYLSTDTILHPEIDLLVASVSSTGTSLAPGQERSRQLHLTVPNGVSGTYYLIGETDAFDVHLDIDRDNNVSLIRDENGDPTLFTVILSPSPDLVITLFSTPATAVAGQPMELIYTIKNNGQGNAVQWQDKMYLSTDNTINHQDLVLLSNNRMPLPSGQSISDTLTANIPAGYFGNYILIMQADANNQVYEHNAEHNNLLSRSINIINPPPSDLIVKDIFVPLEVIAGENINITWTTENIGANPVSGVFREVVYISSDTIWDTDDVVFGTKDQYVYLPPSGNISQQITDNVTGVSIGDYYAIIQTDARQNITESNEDNNFAASTDLMNVDVKTLMIDSLTADTLDNLRELYYKLLIGPELDGETILLNLEGDSTYGLNELFVKYDQMPTRADFDFGYDRPFESDQQIILPNVTPGVYYIMAYGFSPYTSEQPITLLARVIDFEILSFTPKEGVQNTQVTLKITGTKLSNTTEWRLRKSEPWFAVPAISSYIANDNLAFVTFDLTGVPVDTFALDLIKADSSLAFVDNFMVVADGGLPSLEINAQLPGAVPSRPVPVQIVLTFINNGASDVINPAIRVEAPYGNPIAMTLSEIQQNMGSPVLIVPLTEENGPPGVIRPGASGRIEIFSSSVPNGVYTIRLND